MPGIIRIWKWLGLAFWIVLGVTAVVFLISAMQSKSVRTCNGLEVEISGLKNYSFLEKQEVVKLLTANQKNAIKGKPLKDLDLKKMEEKLESMVWVKNAELFFDNGRVLQVKVEEREPVARVFCSNGSTFYIDNSLARLPLSDKFSIRLPVFTGFPSDRKKWKGKDSILMEKIKNISAFIRQDSFWTAQVEQVDIDMQRKFVIIPKTGDHVILFGDGEDIERKFARLYIFYRDVLSKVGWNKYSSINVQYKGQVAAGRKDVKEVKADTLLARQWIKQMILNSQLKVLEDTLTRAQQNSGPSKPVVPGPDTPTLKTQPSKQIESSRKAREAGSKDSKPKENMKPRAVMPSKNNK
jgi:cell division protein FtsQ